jgi:hypothetical protein
MPRHGMRNGGWGIGLIQVITGEKKAARQCGLFYMVRPAGRTHLEVQVLYSPGKGKS